MVRFHIKGASVDNRVLSKWMSSAIILAPLSYLVADWLRISGLIKLLIDFFWIGIVAMVLLQGRITAESKVKPLAVIVSVFLIVTMLVYIFRYQSVFYYLWGARNNFRFYVLFFAVAAYFQEEDGMRCLKTLESLFWVNAVLSVSQFLSGYEQDCIGGLFGVSKGCNAYTIVYFIVVISKSLLSYMNGTESTASCFSKCVVSLFIAAIAELKFYFFVFVFMLVAAMLLTSFSFRKALLLLFSTICVAVMVSVLGAMYTYFEGFFSIDAIVDTLTRTNYASDVDMGRFNAIHFISERFLRDVPSQLFGMGLGNCDVSTFSICSTDFYDTYVDLHYSIFSYAFMFIENGFVGLFLYVLFFVVCLIQSIKRFRNQQGNRLFCQIAIIISLICFILLFYNASLRSEAGFMIYFVLALPFVETYSFQEN